MQNIKIPKQKELQEVTMGKIVYPVSQHCVMFDSNSNRKALHVIYKFKTAILNKTDDLFDYLYIIFNLIPVVI